MERSNRRLDRINDLTWALNIKVTYLFKDAVDCKWGNTRSALLSLAQAGAYVTAGRQALGLYYAQ